MDKNEHIESMVDASRFSDIIMMEVILHKLVYDEGYTIENPVIGPVTGVASGRFATGDGRVYRISLERLA